MQNKRKKALITGCNGQDGSYLTELLLDKGYEVYGMVRRSSVDGHLDRLKTFIGQSCFHLVYADITDKISLENIFSRKEFDEVYHLCAQSQVHQSFIMPKYTEDVNWYGTKTLIDLLYKYNKRTKIYFAGTSELFGNQVSKQNEQTPMVPESPYAEAKLKAFNYCKKVREREQFISVGILFNHESPRRGVEFVTRKITDTVAAMKKGEENVLVLGNLEAKRDWGHAKDYVEAMWRMLQQDKSDDYVIATGKTRSVKELLDIAFKYAKLEYSYMDMKDMSEKNADTIINSLRKVKNKGYYVVSHPAFYRPAEVHKLCGDYSKAKSMLGWEPKISFDELIKDMYESGLKR